MKLVQGEIALAVHFCSDSVEEFERLPPETVRRLEDAFMACLIGGEERRESFLALLASPAFHPRFPLNDGGSGLSAEELARVALAALYAYNQPEFGLTRRESFLALLASPAFRPRFTVSAGGSAPSAEELARAALAALRAYNEGEFGLTFLEPRRRLRRTCVQWAWRRGEFVPIYNYSLEPRRGSTESVTAPGCALPLSAEARSELGPEHFPGLHPRYELVLSLHRPLY